MAWMSAGDSVAHASTTSAIGPPAEPCPRHGRWRGRSQARHRSRRRCRRPVGGDVVGAPALGDRAGEFPRLSSAWARLRGVWQSPQCAKRFDQIGAAVPIGAAILVRLEPLVRIVEGRPERHQPALIEGESQRIGRWAGVHRRQAEQIGLDGADVVVGQQRVGFDTGRPDRDASRPCAMPCAPRG